MAEKIVEHSSKEMYIKDMVSYSIMVNRRRAFPEIRDGLKPVQRRVLYDMYEQGATAPNKRKKSAKITGDTMGNYHVHGDSSIYSCMEVLASWFKTKMPLIYGHGNWGTVMGDPAAAQRYTEASLSEFAYDCIISELKDAKYIVDWKDNYDRTLKEPEFLPSKIPILLINGSFGIGVGMSSNIPPHNLGEVIDATRKLIKNPKADIVLVPDHCQPLKIFDTDWKSLSNRGYGSYKIRGIVETIEDKGYPVICIKSLPDDVTTEAITTKLFDMINNKQLPMIKDVIDASVGTVDIRIVLKKGTDPNYVIETLYSKTGVQSSVSVNFMVVDDVNPKRMSYKEYLLAFLEFRATTKFRLYCNLYKEYSTKAHKLQTYIQVIESGKLPEVVEWIRKQKTVNNEELQEYLIKKLNITDIQANFILSVNIRQLSAGYLAKYKEEYKDAVNRCDIYRTYITDDGSKIMNEIDEELAAISKKYSTPRICTVIDAAEENNIPKGTFKIVITNKNYIRKIPETDKIGVVKGDHPKFIQKVENSESLLIFDNMGKVFKLPVHKIPLTDKSSAGTDIRVLVRNLTADIMFVITEDMVKKIIDSGRQHYIVIATKNNTIKKLILDDFLNVNASGLLYTKLRDGDSVVGISICAYDLDVVIYSKQKALRTPLSEISNLKRNSVGTKAMSISDDIEGISVIYPDTSHIVVVTEKGKFNKFPIGGLSQHHRGTSGNNVIKLDSGDSIFNIYGARDTDEIKIVMATGSEIVPVESIPTKSGVAAGSKVGTVKGPVLKTSLHFNN